MHKSTLLIRHNYGRRKSFMDRLDTAARYALWWLATLVVTVCAAVGCCEISRWLRGM